LLNDRTSELEKSINHAGSEISEAVSSAGVFLILPCSLKLATKNPKNEPL